MTDQPAPTEFSSITLDDVRRAAVNIAPYLSLPTPLIYSPGLSQLLGARPW